MKKQRITQIEDYELLVGSGRNDLAYHEKTEAPPAPPCSQLQFHVSRRRVEGLLASFTLLLNNVGVRKL